jgi:hypothetical protein
MSECPDCHCPLSKYLSGDYEVLVCWNCGYYESNSPAYKAHPELFKNLVRNDPTRFMRQFLKLKSSDEFSQRKPSDDKYTEPLRVTFNSQELLCIASVGG